MIVGYFKNHSDKRTREEVIISTPKVERTTVQRYRLNVTTTDATNIPTLLRPDGHPRVTLYPNTLWIMSL